MAEITTLGFFRHLRADASAHVLAYKRSRLVREGRGLSFAFMPHHVYIAEVPVDDRELPILFHGRSADFQDVTAQGVLTFRVTDPGTLAGRVDFTIDLRTGQLQRQPLEKLALLFSQLAEQHAAGWVGRTPIRQVLAEGPATMRAAIEAGLADDRALPDRLCEARAGRREGAGHPGERAQEPDRAGTPAGGADRPARAERAPLRGRGRGGQADRRRSGRRPQQGRGGGGGEPQPCASGSTGPTSRGSSSNGVRGSRR
jgi:hypothetical protein